MIKKNIIITSISLFVIILIIAQNVIATSADISPNSKLSLEKLPDADIAPSADIAPNTEPTADIAPTLDTAPSADIAPDTKSSVDAAPEADIAPNDDSISADSQDECPLCQLIKEQEEKDTKPIEKIITDENNFLVIEKFMALIQSNEQQLEVIVPCDVKVRDLLDMFFQVLKDRLSQIIGDLLVWKSMTLEQKRDWFDNNFGYIFITYGPTVIQAIRGALLILFDNLHDFIQSIRENLFHRILNIWGWIIVIKDFIDNEKQETYDYLYELICGDDPCPPEDSESISGESETLFIGQSTTGYGNSNL